MDEDEERRERKTNCEHGNVVGVPPALGVGATVWWKIWGGCIGGSVVFVAGRSLCPENEHGVFFNELHVFWATRILFH